MDKKYIITVDGPAGAGKSTVSRELAHRLSYIYLDTGSIYRAFAWKVKNEGLSLDDEEGVLHLCKSTKITLNTIDRQFRVFVDGKDITSELRTQEIGMLASSVSALPYVRTSLLELQREVGKEGGVVAEGRDMGTVVFPEAEFKFFLDAIPEERARRRFKELKARGEKITLEEVKREITQRDIQDIQRAVAPLKPASDAVVIDSTALSVEEVVEKMLAIIGRNSKII